MAKRKNDMAAAFSNLGTVITTVFKIASKLFSSLDIFGAKKQRQEERLILLRSKYSDETVVMKIMNGEYWQGQTAEQLRDSLGEPVAMDDKLLKTRKREVWKYDQHGVNRYRLRITLDDDLVVGWDEKN